MIESVVGIPNEQLVAAVIAGVAIGSMVLGLLCFILTRVWNLEKDKASRAEIKEDLLLKADRASVDSELKHGLQQFARIERFMEGTTQAIKSVCIEQKAISTMLNDRLPMRKNENELS